MCGAIGTVDGHFHLLGAYQVFAFQMNWQDISPHLPVYLLSLRQTDPFEACFDIISFPLALV
jgi:hypothetical protein